MLDKVRARRMLYVRLMIPLALFLLTGRLWYVQIVEGPQFRQQATRNHVRVEVVEPLRGIIFDRYDQQLVENAPRWDVSVVPADLGRANSHAVLQRLARLTGADVSQLELAVRDDRANPALPIVLIYGIGRDVALVLTEQVEDLPGIHVQSRAARQYVDGAAFAGVLGYVGRIDSAQYEAAKNTAQPYSPDDVVGQAGIEKRDETALRGQLGHRTVVVDVGGRTVGTLGEQAAVPGDSIELTLDAAVQRAAFAALDAAVRDAGATEGAVVALDPRDGAVLALASVPSFDPNLFAHGISGADWTRLTSDPAHPLLNHALAAQYPPGAMLNPFVAAAAVQEHVISPGQALTCPAVLQAHGWNFYNPVPAAAGPYTVARALAQHCNTLFVAASGGASVPGLTTAGLGHEKLLSWLHDFGFGVPTGIRLPGEAAGFVPDPAWYQRAQNQAWTPIDTDLVASGAGPVAVTPLQLAVSMAALANGGIIWQPKLQQRLIAPNGTVLQELAPREERRLPLSPATLAAVRDGLAPALPAVRGSGARWEPEVAGTGAAAAPSDSQIGRGGLDSWWSGYAPYDDPQLVVTVLVAGGTNPDAAANVAQATFAAYFAPSKETQASVR